MALVIEPAKVPTHEEELFAPSEQRILSSSRDGTLRVWRALTRKEILTLVGHFNGVTFCAWSPDSQQVVSGSFDITLKIWDTKAGTDVQTLSGHNGTITCCSWSPDGQRIISGCWEDKTVKIWKMKAGQAFLTFVGTQTLSLFVLGHQMDNTFCQLPMTAHL